MTSEQTSPSARAIPLPLPLPVKVKGELGRRRGSGLYNSFVFLHGWVFEADSALHNSGHQSFKRLVNVLVLLG